MTQNVNPGVDGLRISREKYDAVRAAILETVPCDAEGIRFKDLPKEVARRVPNGLFPKKGSASWYTTVVKLDLEARGLIERIPGSNPQRLRRCSREATRRGAKGPTGKQFSTG
jgi:hypothetical protein